MRSASGSFRRFFARIFPRYCADLRQFLSLHDRTRVAVIMTRYISQPGLGGGTIGDTSPYILFEGLTTAMIRVVGRDSEDRKIVFDEPAGSAYCVADMPEAHKKACAREREIAQILWNFHVPIRCDSRS